MPTHRHNLNLYSRPRPKYKMSTENWDDDVDSTQVILSSEDYAKCAAPAKSYDRDHRQSGRGSYQQRSNGSNSRFGDGDRDRGGGGGDWRQSEGRSGQDGQQSGKRWNNDRGSSEDAMQIDIDSSKVGMVIGRGGSKIKEIQDMFGVNVKVGK